MAGPFRSGRTYGRVPDCYARLLEAFNVEYGVHSPMQVSAY